MTWPFREQFEQEWPIKQQRWSERLHFIIGIVVGIGLTSLIWIMAA